MGADGLRVGKVVFLLPELSRFFDRYFIIDIKHVLNVLRLVLRSIRVELLLVRQLDGASAIEELGRSVCGHVLELGSLKVSVLSLTASNAARTDALLHHTIRKDLAVEESQVIRARSREALVRVRVRLELIDDVLSVLGTCQELVRALSASIGLRPSQIVDQLTATAGAFVSLLQLFLDHVLCLGVPSHALAALRLRAPHLSSAVHLLTVAHSNALLSRVHLNEVLLVRE